MSRTERPQRLRSRVLSAMIAEVEDTIDGLRSDLRVFTTNFAMCRHCGHKDSLVYSRCRRPQCRNDDRHRLYCTSDNGVALLPNALNSAHMWPFTPPPPPQLEESAMDFLTKAKNLRANPQLYHIREGDTKCPLQHIGARADEKVDAVIAQCRGISLQSLSEGGDDRKRERERYTSVSRNTTRSHFRGTNTTPLPYVFLLSLLSF